MNTTQLVFILRSQIERISARMFPLVIEEKVNYEPHVKDSFYARAKQKGITAMEAIYDYLAEGGGSNLIYFPIFNYNGGNLNAAHQMLTQKQAQCVIRSGDMTNNKPGKLVRVRG